MFCSYSTSNFDDYDSYTYTQAIPISLRIFVVHYICVLKQFCLSVFALKNEPNCLLVVLYNKHDYILGMLSNALSAQFISGNWEDVNTISFASHREMDTHFGPQYSRKCAFIFARARARAHTHTSADNPQGWVSLHAFVLTFVTACLYLPVCKAGGPRGVPCDSFMSHPKLLSGTCGSRLYPLTWGTKA